MAGSVRHRNTSVSGGVPSQRDAVDDETHVSTAPATGALTDLDPQVQSLLRLMVDGATLGDAARALHLSRRTADRRLAEARRVLGVRSTTEALVAVAAARHRTAGERSTHEDLPATTPPLIEAYPQVSESSANDATETQSVTRGTGPPVPYARQAAPATHIHRIGQLTSREREVLHLVARGLSNSEIGHLLGVSRPTVRRHLENARIKLGARDRIEAAALLAAVSP